MVNVTDMKPHTEHYRFLKMLRIRKVTEEFTFFNLKLLALPQVFSPINSKDTEWFAKIISKLVKDRSFLEIGSGTGAISFVAKYFGAKKVVATDISTSAIENIKLNQKKTLQRFRVIESDIFNKIGNDKFDIIFWNHPFYKSAKRPKDDIEQAISDFNYTSLKKYFINYERFLTKKGKCYLGTGNMSDYLPEIRKLAKETGCTLKLYKKFETTAHKNTKSTVELAVYEIIKIR